MEKFKDGDITFHTSFKIVKNEMMGNMYGFKANALDTDMYEGSRVYKTHREALEALEQMVRELKECC